MTKYLHIADANKFTLPFCELILNESKFQNHKFLFVSDLFETNKYKNNKVSYFTSRFRNHIFRNIKLFYNLCHETDVIYLHGAQFTVLFLIFPRFIKKLAWLIMGADLYQMIKNSNHNFFDINRFVLKRTRIYVSHIEGDVILANNTLNNNAKFHYAPMYLSNTVSTIDFKTRTIENKVRILVGNSNSRNNNHLVIFESLKKFEHDIDFILCPLSYGNDIEYKNLVIETGKKLFGDKFRILNDFISIDQYNIILNEIDIAVFNHWRQEALGVTLSLLALGKIVYINPKTTTYESFIDRGFKIYDNNLLFTFGPTINRDVNANKELIEKYYSKEVLFKTLEIKQ
jgi:dTDP-N-acetylfucosamine:lipid II N-acetylfucosaminyltransferase